MLFPFRRFAVRTAAITSVFLFHAVLALADPVTVAPTVTPGAGIFHYSYSISNNTGDDVFLIDIPVPKLAGAIENLTAPAGFKDAFDSGLGLVSFLEDTGSFGPASQSGFSFDSMFGPGSVSFTASVLSTSTGNIYTVSGPTTAPASAVPEPSSFALLATLTALLLAVKRLRNVYNRPLDGLHGKKTL